jgi:hypothetical protein
VISVNPQEYGRGRQFTGSNVSMNWPSEIQFGGIPKRRFLSVETL